MLSSKRYTLDKDPYTSCHVLNLLEIGFLHRLNINICIRYKIIYFLMSHGTGSQ